MTSRSSRLRFLSVPALSASSLAPLHMLQALRQGAARRRGAADRRRAGLNAPAETLESRTMLSAAAIQSLADFGVDLSTLTEHEAYFPGRHDHSGHDHSGGGCGGHGPEAEGHWHDGEWHAGHEHDHGDHGGEHDPGCSCDNCLGIVTQTMTAGGGVVERVALDYNDYDDGLGGSANGLLFDPPADQLNGAGLQIVLNAAAGMPQFAIDGFQAAADLWQSILTDDIQVNLDIDYRTLSPGILGQAGSQRGVVPVTGVVQAMGTDALSVDDAIAVANLPTTQSVSMLTSTEGTGAEELDDDNSANNNFLATNTANLKALGMLNPSAPGVDAFITFSDQFSWDFDRSDGITPGSFDFIGVAVHEIGHALGFVSGVGTVDFSVNSGQNLDGFAIHSPLDLFRHSAASVAAGADIDTRAFNDDKFFSLDGGQTVLATFSTGTQTGDGRQPSHFKDNLGIGVMDPTASPGEYTDITEFDVTAFDVMGWDIRSDFGDAPDSYGTLRGSGGAVHRLFVEGGQTFDSNGGVVGAEGPATLFLGQTVSGDLDGTATADADADDDDGVAIDTLLTDELANVTVHASEAGVLSYWIDYDQSGTFDAVERGEMAVVAGANSLQFVTPAAAAVGNTYARFRLSSTALADPNETAQDGEVEDYRITIRNTVIDPNDEIAEAAAVGPFAWEVEHPDDLDHSDDVDLFEITAEAGDTVVIDIDTAEGAAPFDSYLFLFDDAGNVLAQNDDGDPLTEPGLAGDASDSHLTYTFAAAGNYYVGVSNAETAIAGYNPVDGTSTPPATPGAVGQYSLTIVDTNDTFATADALAVNDVVVTGIGDGNDVDMYRFDAVAGQQIIFDIDTFDPAGGTNDLDTLLQLFDDAGTLIADNDDSPVDGNGNEIDEPGAFGDPLDSRLFWTFAASGTYYLAVSSFDNDFYDPLDGSGDDGTTRGSYELTAVERPKVDRLNSTVRYVEDRNPVFFARAARYLDDSADAEGVVINVFVTDDPAGPGMPGDGLPEDVLGLIEGRGVVTTTTTFGAGTGQIGITQSGVGVVPVADVVFSGNAMELTFLAGATSGDVTRVIRRLAYQNTSELPDTSPRRIQVTVVDGDGIGSQPGPGSASQLNIVSVADPTDIGPFDSDVVFTEGGPAVQLASNLVVSDADTADYGGARFEAVVLTPRDAGDLLQFIAVDPTVTVTGTGPGAVVSVGGTDIATLGTGESSLRLVLDFLAGATAADVATAIEQVHFFSTDDAPRGPKTMRLTFTDPAGGRSVFKPVIDIQPVNDPPTLANVDGNTINVTAGAGKARVSPSLAIVDPDFNGGGGRYEVVVSGGTPTESVSINERGLVTLGNDGTNDTVLFNGTVVGTITGLDTGSMVVTFNSSASFGAIRTIGRELAFVADAGTTDGDYFVEIQFFDEAGAGSNIATVTASVTGGSGGSLLAGDGFSLTAGDALFALPAITAAMQGSIADEVTVETATDEDEADEAAALDEAIETLALDDLLAV